MKFGNWKIGMLPRPYHVVFLEMGRHGFVSYHFKWNEDQIKALHDFHSMCVIIDKVIGNVTFTINGVTLLSRENINLVKNETINPGLIFVNVIT